VTDGRTDGIAVASTALAMRALRRAVKKHNKTFCSRMRGAATVLIEFRVDSLGVPSDIFEMTSKLVLYFGSGRGAKFRLFR